MSSFLCFVCHSTVNAVTSEDIREKYREVVGMHLCMDSHLCYICCHVLNKLWLFRAVCLKRSLEYPVLFSEKGTLNLQRNDLEIHTICPEDVCGQFLNGYVNSKVFQISYDDCNMLDSQEFIDNEYVKLQGDRTDIDEYFQKDDALLNKDIIRESNTDTFNEYINNSPDKVSKDEETFKTFDVNQTIDTDIPVDNFDTNVAADFLDNDDTMQEEGNFKTSSVLTGKDVFIAGDFQNKEVVKDVDKEPPKKRRRPKKCRKKGYDKIVLSLEEQKAELDRRRKEKKYMEALFKCYNCALGFLFKDTYQTHMMRHEESNGEYRCDTCTLRFATPAVLRAHTANHSERYECTACKLRVVPRARTTHARRCWNKTGEEVSCHLCGGMFQDPAGLQQHLKRFHRANAGNRTYACGVCGESHSNQAAVRTHMLKHINRKFECSECPAVFSTPYTRRQHARRKHGARAETFRCEACDLAYSSRKSLLSHQRNALKHQQTVYECLICTRMCPNQRSLASHMQSVHSASKNYSCAVCSARYTNRKSLVRHIGAHQGKGAPKPHVCHLCGATFQGKNKLNRHLKEVCEKSKLEEEFANIYQEDCINPG